MLVLSILATFHLLKYASSAIVIAKPKEGYDKTVRPNDTVILEFHFDVETISEIDPNTQIVQMSIMFGMFWKDHRIEVTTVGDVTEDSVSIIKDLIAQVLVFSFLLIRKQILLI